MSRIRAEARRSVANDGRPFDRITRSSIFGATLAASIGSITTFANVVPSEPVGRVAFATGVVIADTVVDRLRDTMRLVRLIRANEHLYAVLVDNVRLNEPHISDKSAGDLRTLSILSVGPATN